MRGKAYWYVIHVRTGRENSVVQFFKKRLDTNIFMPFIPLLETIFIKSGVTKKELNPLFPGYVFIEAEVSGNELIKSINSLFNTSSDIFSLLKYSDSEIAMRETEKQLLLELCNDNHCIESSSGIIIGDTIFVTSGPLKGWEGIVRKVDRHKRQVWIEMEFMGETRLVSLGMEITEKRQ